MYCLSTVCYRVSLVNGALVNYFLVDLEIEGLFLALRRYLCMGDGDFSEILCDLLMEKVRMYCPCKVQTVESCIYMK